MNDKILRHDKNCRICNSNKIETVMRLVDTPLEDQFLKDEFKDTEQPSFPLELAICLDCHYLHLPHIVNPEASYADYVYVSGVTVGLRDHYDDYAKQVINDFNIAENSLVIDLGSNDGSMLASFKRVGMRVLGVEPATAIAELANTNDLPTINDFFSDAVVENILDEYGHAKVVTANYMYANIDDVLSFTNMVAKVLDKDGVFVVQTGYHPEQMKINMFDYIYHEHFSYFTVEVLGKIFEQCGLIPIHAEKTKPKGGSIRVVGQLKQGSKAVDSSVIELLEEEHRNGMNQAGAYLKFSEQINVVKSNVVEELRKLRKEGKRIVGFGASHSTTTLLYHFELAEYFEYLVDDNSLKHGSYSPGYHLPVYPTDKLYKDKPDYVVLLAWQHTDSILKRHKAIFNLGMKFLVPLPELKIIDSSD
jgi:SAM-dependent methyltransferase